jgi:hypothetical protein
MIDVLLGRVVSKQAREEERHEKNKNFFPMFK